MQDARSDATRGASAYLHLIATNPNKASITLSGKFSDGAAFGEGTLTVRVDGVLTDVMVPEPGSLALISLSLMAGAGASRRRCLSTGPQR